MLLIRNAHLVTMTETDYPRGDLLLDGGKIVAVGNTLSAPGAEVIDAHGMTALPGLIDAHCHIGMWENAMGFEGSDGNEMTDPVTPALRAIDAINPLDECFRESLQNGVTLACTGPGSANVVGGQFALMKTVGASVEEMLVKAPAALKIALGENPKRVYSGQKKTPSTRMATAALLRQELIKAQEYLRHQSGEKAPDRDLGLEILGQALKRELVVKAHAHRADDIQTALRIADEFHLCMTLEHCTEGYLCPEVLKASGRGVILGPLLTDRSKIELRNLSFDAPRVLYEHGVPFALMTDHPVIPQMYLMVQVGLAVRAGLPEREGYKSVTCSAADLLGVGDRFGRLQPGCDADICLYDGSPMDLRTRVRLTLVGGRRVYEA